MSILSRSLISCVVAFCAVAESPQDRNSSFTIAGPASHDRPVKRGGDARHDLVMLTYNVPTATR